MYSFYVCCSLLLFLRGPHLASRIAIKILLLIPQRKLIWILGFNFCIGHFFTYPLREEELVTTGFVVSTEVQGCNRKKRKSKWLRSVIPLCDKSFRYCMDGATPSVFVYHTSRVV